MKRFFGFLTAIVLSFSACTQFDDSELLGRLDKVEGLLQKLEELCGQLNANVSSLQSLVNALENQDYIADVVPLVKDGAEIGYTIVFAKGDPIIIYHASGAGGSSDGYTPVIGVRKASDGLYYWTLDGEWLLDDNGNRILAQGTDGNGMDGVVPTFRIENGYWYVSYDDGLNWEKVGRADCDEGNGDRFFKSVVITDDSVGFVLHDGTEFSIPKLEPLNITFDEDEALPVGPYGSVSLNFEVSGNYEDVVVEAVPSGGVKAKVNLGTSVSGSIDIEMAETVDEYCKVVVLVYDGLRTIIRTILFKEARIEIIDSSDRDISSEGGEMELEYMSDVQVDVIIPQDAAWISLVSTKTMEKHAIILKVEKNTGQERSADIKLVSEAGISLTYTVKQKAPRNIAERQALIDLFNLTGGDKWSNNENWCSDKPLREWFGIMTNAAGHVTSIELPDNNLIGRLPESIGNLESLEYLHLNDNKLVSNIPESIGNCQELYSIWLNNNNLGGLLPEALSKLRRINTLVLSGNYFDGTIPDWLYDMKSLEQLLLGSNKFKGKISEDIGYMTDLRVLSLSYNLFEGEFPESIGNLKKMVNLDIDANYFTGAIPESIGNLTELVSLSFAMNLFTSIPDSIINLKKLLYFRAYELKCSGTLSEVIVNSEFGSKFWPCLLGTTGYTYSGTIYAPVFSHVETVAGEILSSDIYKENKLTMVTAYHRTDAENLKIYNNQLKEYYETYSEHGLDMMGYFSVSSYDQMIAYINEAEITWHMFDYHDDSNDFVFAPSSHPFSILVDSDGKVLHHTAYDNNFYETFDAFEKIFNETFNPDNEMYESTDYSQDGKVKVLQKATIGNGIDVVLMGDAYSDRLIADGSYDKDMKQALESFFTEEPYKSFRDYFNVYQVNVVSKNEEYSESSSTALETWFGEGTRVGGNNDTALEYALKAVDEAALEDALVVVMMNKNTYAGTCYMYNPQNGDYGRGKSVSYFPASHDVDVFTELLLHEAGGHGFAKLADEYSNEGNLQVPSSVVESNKGDFKYGWWKNVDFTANLNGIKWSKFIFDSRYENEGLGAYEGGLTYWYGVWRPTENSIMRSNTDSYNAPSREAIYYRIHKLAFGEDWEYDYEEFVKYDEVNRKAKTKSGVPYKPMARENFVPLAPPVVIYE